VLQRRPPCGVLAPI